MHQVRVPGSRRPVSAAARSLPSCAGLRELGLRRAGLPPAVAPRPLCAQGAPRVRGGAPSSPGSPRALSGFKAGVGGVWLTWVVRLVVSVCTWVGCVPTCSVLCGIYVMSMHM